MMIQNVPIMAFAVLENANAQERIYTSQLSVRNPFCLCTVYMQVYIQTNQGCLYNMHFGFCCSDLTHELVWSFQFINQHIKNDLVGTYLVTSNKVYQKCTKMLKFEKVTWAGPNCTTHNHLYFHSFSLVFYGLMTVSFIQLFFCIRKDTQFTVFTSKVEGQRN